MFLGIFPFFRFVVIIIHIFIFPLETLTTRNCCPTESCILTENFCLSAPPPGAASKLKLVTPDC